MLPATAVEGSGRFCRSAVLLDRLVEEAADGGTRVGADEAADRTAVTEYRDGRDALDAVLSREHLLGVDVDLGELDLVRALGDLGFDRGAEHATGATPCRPEVDDDGQLVRALDHVVLKGLGGHVHRGVLLQVVPPTRAARVESWDCSEPQICSQRLNTPSSAIR